MEPDSPSPRARNLLMAAGLFVPTVAAVESVALLAQPSQGFRLAEVLVVAGVVVATLLLGLVVARDRRPGARWVDWVVAFCVACATWTILFLVARETGPAVPEADTLRAVRAVGAWFDRIGSGDLRWTDAPPRDHALREAGPALTLPALLSALVWHIATSGYGWLREVVSFRAGTVLFSGLGLPLLILLVLPHWGRRAAWFACAAMLFVPRFVHMASLAAGPAVSATAWLLVLVPYARSRRSSGWGWTVWTGLAIGVACAITPSALALVLVLLVHTAWDRRTTLPTMLGTGLVPLPASLLSGATLGVGVYYACSGWLWAHPGDALVKLLAGGPKAAEPVAGWSFPFNAIVMSVPTVTLALALVGAVVVAGPPRARAWGRPQGEGDDDGGLGALVLVALVVAIAWTSVAPASLATQPPAWLMFLPLVAALAGRGLDRSMRACEELLRERGRALRGTLVSGLAVLAIAVPALETVRQPDTRSAAFIPLMGGPSVVRAIPGFPLHDGSLARALAASVDGLQRPSVALHGNAIPFETWELFRTLGWMRTRVRPAKSVAAADVVVLGGTDAERAGLLREVEGTGRDARRLSAVERDGATLAELYTLARRPTR